MTNQDTKAPSSSIALATCHRVHWWQVCTPLIVTAMLATACGDQTLPDDMAADPYPAVPDVLTVDRDAIIDRARAEIFAAVPQADTTGEPTWLMFDQFSVADFLGHLDWSQLYVVWELPDEDHIAYTVEGAGALASTAVGARLMLNGATDVGPSVMRMVEFTYLDKSIPLLHTYAFVDSGLVTFADDLPTKSMQAVLDGAVAQYPAMTYVLLELVGIASLEIPQAQLSSALAYLREQPGVIGSEITYEQYAGVFYGSPAKSVASSQAAIDLRPYLSFTGDRREQFIFYEAPTLSAPFGPGPVEGIGEGLVVGDGEGADAANGYVAMVADGYDQARCLATIAAQFPELTLSTFAASDLRVTGDSQRMVYESIATITTYPCIAAVRPAGKDE